MNSKYLYKLFITEDGSHSLVLNDFDESYHSKYGAIAESEHIYINAGLKYLMKHKKEISVLEIGFGTGLNALLTLNSANNSNCFIDYHTIEPYPIHSSIFEQLNYPQIIGNYYYEFLLMHNCEQEIKIPISAYFNFKKSFCSIQEIELLQNHYNIIYFDAFNPLLEPEMWTEEILIKLFNALSENGVLLTYSTKGEVRRTMIKAGFCIEKLKGPKGKREICRALKS